MQVCTVSSEPCPRPCAPSHAYARQQTFPVFWCVYCPSRGGSVVAIAEHGRKEEGEREGMRSWGVKGGMKAQWAVILLQYTILSCRRPKKDEHHSIAIITYSSLLRTPLTASASADCSSSTQTYYCLIHSVNEQCLNRLRYLWRSLNFDCLMCSRCDGRCLRVTPAALAPQTLYLTSTVRLYSENVRMTSIWSEQTESTVSHSH